MVLRAKRKKRHAAYRHKKHRRMSLTPSQRAEVRTGAAEPSVLAVTQQPDDNGDDGAQ